MIDYFSENDNLETLLVEIWDLVKIISKVQKSVGAFIGEDTRKIRGLVFFIGVFIDN